jgi:hypothetical protein
MPNITRFAYLVKRGKTTNIALKGVGKRVKNAFWLYCGA